MNARRLVVAAAVVVGLAPGPTAQQPGQTGTIRIDAIVTDRADRPVRDLGPADFELRESGEPRVIESATRQPSGGSRIVAIFLDEYHLQAGESTARARAALTRFVETQLRADDLVAVMKPLDPLTSIRVSRDRSTIREAIEHFNGRKGDYAPRTPFEEKFMSRAPREADANRAQVVSSALQALTQRLGELREGRKAIVFVSEGFTAATARASDRSDRLIGSARAIVFTANRYGVAIYPVDPQTGPATGDQEAANRATATLRALAEQTGGRASLRQTDLAVGMRQAVEDLDEYYVLTYHAPQAGGGTFHPVELRVKRGDAQIRTRAGYWEPPAAASRPTAGATVLAGLLPVRPPHTSPYIRSWIGMSRGPEGLTRVAVTWEPGGAPLPRNQRVESVVVKVTTDDGRVLFQNPIAASRLAAFNMPPGYVAIEMSVQDGSGRTFDTDSRGMQVRDLRSARPTFATAQLLRTRSARAFASASVDPDAAPSPASEFSRAERLLVRIPVYGPGGAPPVVTATLLNRAGTPMRPLSPVLPALPDGVVQFDLPLSSLAPDEYRVELVARTGAQEAREVVLFRVVN